MQKVSLIERIRRYPRRLLSDDRGWFLKTITGKEEGLPDFTGEVYFTSAKAGCNKGGHYHELAQEWFTMIVGKGVLVLEDIDTKERIEIEMIAEQPETIYIPQRVAHRVDNRSDKDYIMCAYTDVLYDPKDTIAYEFNGKIL